MRDAQRRPCTRCDVVGPHAGALCRRCSTISGVKFELAPRPAEGELLPDAFHYVAVLHQAAGAAACALAAFLVLAGAAGGDVLALGLLAALRIQAMRATLRREAAGWWMLAVLAVLDLPFAMYMKLPVLTAAGVATLALIAPQAVRSAAVEPPARGVPLGMELLRGLHVVIAALILIAGIHRFADQATRLLAIAAACAQLVVPPLVIGCGGRGWRWWVALCACGVAGGLLAAPWAPAGWLLAAAGAGGLRYLLTDPVRAWGHRGRMLPPAGLASLAAVSLVVRALAAGGCLLALAGDPGLAAAWAALAYLACGMHATLGTLAGDRRCWLAWRGANVLDAALLIALAAFGWWAAAGGATLAYGLVLFVAGTGLACTVANRLLADPDVVRFAAPESDGRPALAPHRPRLLPQ